MKTAAAGWGGFRPATCFLAIPALFWGCGPGGGKAVPADSVVDDRGRAHQLPSPRTRIISLIPAATEILVAIGAADRLVARTRYDEQPELADLPSVGGGIDPSLEFLTQLSPDLVIHWPAGGRGASLGGQLAEVGFDGYGAAIQTVADFNRHARNFGRLVGHEGRADSLVAAVQADLDAARESWYGRDPLEVVYVVQHDPPMTVGPGTFLDSVLAAAGAVNAFRDIRGNWPVVSMEQVVWRDPDYLVVPVVGYGTPAVPPGYRDPSAARLAERPGWSAVSAVTAGRVISVDASLFGRPGPRMGHAARYLSFRLHGAATPGGLASGR